MTILFRCHLLQQIPSENDSAAPTPRSTCVNVLCVRIKEKYPAVYADVLKTSESRKLKVRIEKG